VRVTACNLLHRQGFSDSYIQARLLWKSNTFLQYLRNTLYTAAAHTKALSIPVNNLPVLTSEWETVTLPTGKQAMRNVPVGRGAARPIVRRRGPKELKQVLFAGRAA